MTGANGNASTIPPRGTEGVRRQADGTRRFAIDNPTGTA